MAVGTQGYKNEDLQVGPTCFLFLLLTNQGSTSHPNH